MLSKYGRGCTNDTKMTAKAGDSKLWKEITKLWAQLQEHVNYATDDAGNSSHIWQPSVDGEFTVASYYKLRQDLATNPRQKEWKLIWKLQIPERIRHFTWIASHGRLTTQSVTCKWENTSALCKIRQGAMEDQTHALRDCPHASQFWKQLLPLNCWTKFFSEDTKSWFRANLQYYDKITNRKNWAEVFATSCWFIWRWRNSQLHEDNPEMPRKPAMQIWKYINNYSQKWGGDNLQEHRGKSYVWPGLYHIRDG